MPEDNRNIYQRVIAVREKARYVQKDLTIAYGAGYRAVSHDAVVAAVRKAMDEEGIVLKLDYDHERSEVSIEQNEKGMRVFMQGRFTASFISADSHRSLPAPTRMEPYVRQEETDLVEDRIVIDIPAHAMDSGDKAPGKLMSYAKKYALLHMFLLETGEEEESRAAEVDELKLEMALAKIAAYLSDEKPLEALKLIEQGDLTLGEKIKLNAWLNSRQKGKLREARQEQALAKLKEKEKADA